MDVMKIKKAINVLLAYEYSTKLELSEGTRNNECESVTIADFMLMKELAIKTLQKEIPIITTETQSVSGIEYICPVCNHTSGLNFKYCWNCGQSIRNLEGVGL